MRADFDVGAILRKEIYLASQTVQYMLGLSKKFATSKYDIRGHVMISEMCANLVGGSPLNIGKSRL